MLFELILLSGFGIVFCVIGWQIWKEKKITLIHSYHWDKVAEADKPVYTALVGKGVLLIGVGMILTGIIDYVTGSGWGWIAFGISFISGLILMIIAGIRYDHD